MYLTEGINIIVVMNNMAITIMTNTCFAEHVVNISTMAKLESTCAAAQAG